MGVQHLRNVTPKDLERAGVSQREFDLINKLMALDPEIFLEKYLVMVRSPTPYYYTVDLSKYDQKKIPQDLKEILYRPKKMSSIYEKYWRLASDMDRLKREEDKTQQRLRWHHHKLHKEEDAYMLADKLIATLDQVADQDTRARRLAKKQKQAEDWEEVRGAYAEKVADDLASSGLANRDAFSVHARKIQKQVLAEGFLTKAQLEYLNLYNLLCDWEERVVFSDTEVATALVLRDLQEDWSKKGTVELSEAQK